MPYLSFREYLSDLSGETGGSTADYGSYLKELTTQWRFGYFTSSVSFLIDYKSMGFPFIGHNVRQVLGHRADAYREGGLEFSFHQNKDFAFLNRDIFEDRAAFMTANPGFNLEKLRFSMGYRYSDERGRLRSILQRHTITELADGINPAGILGFCLDVTDHTPDTRIFHQIETYNESLEYWEPVVTKEYFPHIDEDKLLSKRELEILKWVMEGSSSKQIADRLFVSIHTINAHRKNMLRKTNSRNMTEVANYAMRHRLV